MNQWNTKNAVDSYASFQFTPEPATTGQNQHRSQWRGPTKNRKNKPKV